MRYFNLIFLLLLLTGTVSCNKSQEPETGSVAAVLYDYTGLDGCSWVIKLTTEEVLEPINLGDFNLSLKEGKKVWIKYTVADDQISICMVGPKIVIEDIWER